MSDQEQTIEQRSNDHVTVLFKTKPGCVIKMEVHVSPPACRSARAKALKEVRREISLPGFRKGKVPEEIVVQQFGPQVDRHAKEVLLDTAFREAVALVERPPFTTRSIRKSEIKQQTKDGASILLFEYEATPQVPTVDLSQISLQPVEIQEPTEEEVERSLTRLKVHHGTKTEVSDREILEGDVVTLSLLEKTEEDQPTPSHLVDNEQFYVKKGFLPQWLMDAILGMKMNETKDVESIPEDPMSEAVFSKKCTVVIHAIQECALPQEDDSFAQKTGAQSMADLKDKLLERARQEKRLEAQNALRVELKNELIRHYAFDLPQSLIEGETEARFRPYLESLDKQKNAPPIDKEAARNEFQEEVKRYFTCLFLMERISKEAKPTYSQAEFFDELTQQMIKAPFQERSVYPGLSQEEIQQRILMNIMMKKCYDWCIEQKLGSAQSSS